MKNWPSLIIGKVTAKNNEKFEFNNFAQSLEFVNKVGEIAEDANHHPDIEFGWGYANITFTSHDIGGLSERDLKCATAVDENKNMSDKIIEKFVLDTGKAWKTLVVFGAIHGNEKCGTEAIKRALKDNLKPNEGKIIYVPICNPRAYAEDVRFIDRNLNRHLFPKENPQNYEEHLDGQICAILDEADFC